MSTDEKLHLHGIHPPFANAELVLLPLEFSEARELAGLARNLSSTGLKVAIAPSRNIDSGSYAAARNQYRADELLAQARQAATGRVLAITEVDLYVPGLIFVFGMAGRDAAVVSAHRLRLGADAALVARRLFKEALHEIGHTFGLGHCDDPHCVMSFSNSLAEADRKSSLFCSACRARLYARALP